MARGKRNDHIQTDPDSGVNMKGETFDTFEPMERVQDGLQGQNSASNIGKSRDQLHHVCHAPNLVIRVVRRLVKLIQFKLLIDFN